MKGLIAGASFLITMWLATPFFLSCLYPDMASRGQFGDMFGAINALFSGLALLGTIYAVILQQRELELQREELMQSRAELAAQNAILAEQLKASREAHEFEMQKERSLAEPQFTPQGGHGGSNMKHAKFQNMGGDIRQLEVTPVSLPTGRIMTVSPSDILKHGQTMTLDIPGDNFSPELPDILFTLSFTNRLGVRCHHEFVLPAGELRIYRKLTT